MKVVIMKSHEELYTKQGFISWRRFEQALKSNGEIAKYEDLVSVEISDDGVKYSVCRNENNNNR